MSVIVSLANRAYMMSAAPARARFERAARRPADVQRALLQRMLARNAGTAFGREHGFDRIRTLRDYQAQVPLRDWDAYAPWVDRVAAGEPGTLTAELVRFVEPSGGSSGASKLVPYTDRLLAQFSRATMPWIFDLLAHRPRLRDGRAYWSITPPARLAARTRGGLSIGMEHDSDYFPPVVRALLDRVLGAPRALARAPDVETCRYLTLRALLALPDLALISVWNPSFLTLLAQALDHHFPALLRDLETGNLSVPLPDALRAELTRVLPARPARARALREAFGARAPADLALVWPRLALISCWADGHAARALGAMRERFPFVEVQSKGLLATEGVISFPLFAAGGAVAAVTSHFLELLPLDAPDRGVPIEHAEPGRSYEVALTTAGGLYRYRLRDVVRAEGFYRATPVLAFEGRADRASDLAGEKLTAAHVERVLARAMRETGIRAPFAMLAPWWGTPPRYYLYVEAAFADARRLADAVESTLCAGHHYALCRALGQLGAVRPVAVREGERVYERVCADRGQRAGVVKPVALDPSLDWERHFATHVSLDEQQEEAAAR